MAAVGAAAALGALLLGSAKTSSGIMGGALGAPSIMGRPLPPPMAGPPKMAGLPAACASAGLRPPATGSGGEDWALPENAAGGSEPGGEGAGGAGMAGSGCCGTAPAAGPEGLLGGNGARNPRGDCIPPTHKGSVPNYLVKIVVTLSHMPHNQLAHEKQEGWAHARTGLGDSKDAMLSLVVLRSGALEGRCPLPLAGCPALPGKGRPGGTADKEPWLDSRSACAAALSAPASVALAPAASLSLITTCIFQEEASCFIPIVSS